MKIRPGPGQGAPAPPAKGKGKEKVPAGQPLPPPITSAPLPHLHDQAGESISMGPRMPMDVEWEEELRENDPAVDRRTML